MPVEISLEDPRLDVFRELPRLQSGPVGAAVRTTVAIAEGAIVVKRALELGARVQRIVCTPSQAAKLTDHAPAGVPVFTLSRADLATLTGFDFHRGCLAAVEVPGVVALSDAILAGWARREPLTIVAASRLADPVNVGAVIRSAVALGADACVFDGACASPYERRAIRAAMGHCLAGTTFCVPNLGAALDSIRATTGARVYATSPASAGRALPEVDWAGKRVLVLGHEGDGLGDDLFARADECVFVPMAAGIDSLNVAATAAIMLYATRS